VATLLRLTRIARAGGAKVVTGAAPGVVGCRSLGDAPDPEDWDAPPDEIGQAAWSALRRAPEGAEVAVAWPRLLARLPYGEATDQVEGFAFEELADGFAHERLLWGNGAYAVAAAVARAHASGDEVDPEIADLPALVVAKDGDSELQPCAEAYLRTRGIERAVSRGLLPLVSVKGQATVRLGNLNALSNPPARLF
jgi:type VI secretion system protein ImpC